MVTFTLEIPHNYPENTRVAVRVEGELPEYGQVWVWDMLFAQTMNRLGTDPQAHELKETLDIWAVNMSSKIYQPFDHVRSKGHTNLSEQLEIGEPESETTQVKIQVAGRDGELPQVTLVDADSLSPQQLSVATLALAQYFIDQNDLFAKELPIHILAFRKYYSDVRPAADDESVEEAPLYAIQKALEYFNSVTQGNVH
ncbi:MAG: hypothetical protein P8019_15950 [Gammaproteobacteria bacterium]